MLLLLQGSSQGGMGLPPVAAAMYQQSVPQTILQVLPNFLRLPHLEAKASSSMTRSVRVPSLSCRAWPAFPMRCWLRRPAPPAVPPLYWRPS